MRQTSTVSQCVLSVAVAVAMVATAFPAAADFRICNVTKSRIGIAIGYKDAEGWATEGWWNLKAGDCETLLRGTLAARFYYLYAVDYDHGGEWAGQAFMCTRDKEFTIRGTNDCLARGFDRTGFFEVDTGEQQTWTVQLTDGAETRRPNTAPALAPPQGPTGLPPGLLPPALQAPATAPVPPARAPAGTPTR